MHGHLVHMDGRLPLGVGPRTKRATRILGLCPRPAFLSCSFASIPAKAPPSSEHQSVSSQKAQQVLRAHTSVAGGPVPESTQFPMMALSTTGSRHSFSEIHSPIPLARRLSPVLQETPSGATLPGAGCIGRCGL